jgi:hypothetical protein
MLLVPMLVTLFHRSVTSRLTLSFRVIIFYPMTAISAIFSVALLDSRSDPGSERLKLLQGFTRLIRQIPIKRLTVAEISHLEFIEEVVGEMSRLVLAAQ